MKLKIKKIRSGSSYYDIEYVDELKNEENVDLYGRIWQAQRLIRISNKISYQTQLQTLLHECVHDIFWEYEVDDDKKNVELLSNGFYALIADNPDFIKRILAFRKTQKKAIEKDG